MVREARRRGRPKSLRLYEDLKASPPEQRAEILRVLQVEEEGLMQVYGDLRDNLRNATGELFSPPREQNIVGSFLCQLDKDYRRWLETGEAPQRHPKRKAKRGPFVATLPSTVEPIPSADLLNAVRDPARRTKLLNFCDIVPSNDDIRHRNKQQNFYGAMEYLLAEKEFRDSLEANEIDRYINHTSTITDYGIRSKANHPLLHLGATALSPINEYATNLCKLHETLPGGDPPRREPTAINAPVDDPLVLSEEACGCFGPTLAELLPHFYNTHPTLQRQIQSTATHFSIPLVRHPLYAVKLFEAGLHVITTNLPYPENDSVSTRAIRYALRLLSHCMRYAIETKHPQVHQELAEAVRKTDRKFFDDTKKRIKRHPRLKGVIFDFEDAFLDL